MELGRLRAFCDGGQLAIVELVIIGEYAWHYAEKADQQACGGQAESTYEIRYLRVRKKVGVWA